MKTKVILAHVALYIFLTCLSALLASLMAGKCRASTSFIKTWTLTEPRESMNVIISDGSFAFTLSLEYQEKDNDEEAFGAGGSFSVLKQWDVKDLTLTLGAGLGFLLELQWVSTEYNIIGETITYPDINTDTWMFATIHASMSLSAFLVIFEVRLSEDWVRPVLGIGFVW